MIGLFFITLGCFRTYGFPQNSLRARRNSTSSNKNGDSRSAVFVTSDGLSHTVLLGNSHHLQTSPIDVYFFTTQT